MKTLSLSALSILIFLTFHPQNGNAQTLVGKNQLFLQTTYGFHFPSDSDFEKIYDAYDITAPFFTVGFGKDGYFLIGRYFKSYLSADTQTEGVVLINGTVTYNRDTFYAGFRSNGGTNSPVYAEICYIYTQITEEMKTKSPRLPELEGTTTIYASGASLGAGLLIPFGLKNLNASFHFNYDFYIRAKANIAVLEIRKLGGLNATVGILYVFSF